MSECVAPRVAHVDQIDVGEEVYSKVGDGQR